LEKLDKLSAMKPLPIRLAEFRLAEAHLWIGKRYLWIVTGGEDMDDVLNESKCPTVTMETGVVGKLLEHSMSVTLDLFGLAQFWLIGLTPALLAFLGAVWNCWADGGCWAIPLKRLVNFAIDEDSFFFHRAGVGSLIVRDHLFLDGVDEALELSEFTFILFVVLFEDVQPTAKRKGLITLVIELVGGDGSASRDLGILSAKRSRRWN
jgi:hypothetical protein